VKNRKFIEIFVREAEEHLKLLRDGLLALEREGFSRERVHEILRSAHTLKGSARMLDLTDLAEVAHKLEDLIKDIEEERRVLSPALIDLLLVATDALEALTAQAHSGGEIQVNIAAVLVGLETGVLPEITEVEALQAPTKKENLDTVRTSVARLDTMVNLLGELLISRRMIEERGRSLVRLKSRMDTFLRGARKGEDYTRLKELFDDVSRVGLDLERDSLQLNYLVEEVHSQAMELRMLPLSTITDDVQRSVRNLSREQGKEIQFTIVGDDVEMDRMMIEAAKPMLVHMLNNAVDHGIETPEERRIVKKDVVGKIELKASHEAGGVVLTLRDDGRGIDPEKVRQTAVKRGVITAEEVASITDEEAVYLILRPGFTTRDQITNVSGRGVGMDVVKTNIDRVKGNLVIHSTPGKGTEMILLLPLTMAIISGLLVDCEGENYVIPLHYISETLRLSEKEILMEGGREIIRVRGRTMPLVSLQETLGLPKVREELSGRVTAVVLNFRERQLACVVTRSFGAQEVVVKGMGGQLKSVEFFSGATILPDGSPALILSVPDLFTSRFAERGSRLRRDFEETREKAEKGRILVVDDSITTRIMEKNILETHGYRVTVAISGEDALVKVAESDFDLVVSDVEMPGISGFELTRRLRDMERFREVPVIIVTSLASDEHKRMGLEVGAQAYIVKGSFDQGTLLSTVETLIG